MTTAAAIALARVADEAARGVPGVLDLHAGAVGEFTTYGGGERVRGIRVTTGPPLSVALRLVAAYGYPLPELTDEVRTRVRGALEGVTGQPSAAVDLHIVDVREETEVPAMALPAESGTTPDRRPTTPAAPGEEPSWRS